MKIETYPERGKHLYEEIVVQIQDLIRRGELREGEKLPPERKLAETFKVSRNCVREAIRVLAEKKILKSRRGDGTYICTPDKSALADSLAQAIETQKSRLRDIFEFRQMIEPQIAFLAAHHITRGELDALKILVFEQERKMIAGEDASDLDTAFHLRLAIASKNKVLQEVIRTINGLLAESRSEFLQSEARRKTSVRAHIMIIDALEKKDPKGARRAMHDHLLQVRQTVFGDDEAWGYR